MKLRLLLIVGVLFIIGLLLNNGIINRPSTEAEAISWAASNLLDREYVSMYTSEETLYDENGNPTLADVPDGAVVTIHWSGELFEKNDDFGKRWCFKMQLIARSIVIKNEDKCEDLSRNTLTGKLLRD